MPSSPYKSRLLTVLSERSLKLRDQAQRRLRQVQTAAVWSAQIVLYPVYAAFQSGRVASRQMGQTARRVFPRLQSAAQAVKQSVDPSPKPVSSQTLPTSDSPIRQTLRSLDLLALPLPVASAGAALSPASSAPVAPLSSEPAPQTTLAHPHAVQANLAQTDLAKIGPQPSAIQPPNSPKIRGIACHTDSQRLVLIDQYNAIHDLLTPAQAAHLHRRLVLELAKFWQAHKRLQFAHQPAVPLPLPRDRQTMLPPIRAWRRLMAWMQTSPVAQSTNLFQEARQTGNLHLPNDDRLERALLGRVLPPDALEGASQSVAHRTLDGAPTNPFSPTHAAPTASPSWWSRLVPNWLQPDSSEAPSPPRWFDPDHQGDEEGWQNANQLAQDHQAQLPPTKPSLPVPAAQRWAGLWPWGKSEDMPVGDSLALDEVGPDDAVLNEAALNDPTQVHPDALPAEAGELVLRPHDMRPHDIALQDSASSNSRTPSGAASSPPQYQAAPDLLNEIEQYLRGLLGSEGEEALAPAPPSGLTRASEHSLETGSPVSMLPVGTAGESGQLSRSEDKSDGAIASSKATSQGLQTTWLETQATPLGYERHFLEQILQWVDQSLAWIEAWLVKVLQWLKLSR